MMDLPEPVVDEIAARALAEDVGLGDVTTLATVPEDTYSRGEVIAKAEGVLAGLGVMRAVFLQVDPGLAYEAMAADGERVEPGQVVAAVTGDARAMLIGERTALNFLQRMSGVATLTAKYVAAVAGTRAQILDTRKTMPGLRVLDKYAVRAGGGRNHRFGLFDGVLIKDNHIAAAGGITTAMERARASVHHLLQIEVEVTTVVELEEALAAGARVILLDNMTPEQAAEAAARAHARNCLVEVSGNVTLDTVRAYAEAGADLISAGALTHSAVALNFSLEVSAASG